MQIQVNERQVFGRQVKARRRGGLIPANIVVKGEASLAIEIPANQLLKVLQQVGYTQPLELEVGPRKITTLISEVSYAPTADMPQHVVFTAVKRGEIVSAAVPLVLVGKAPGEQKGLLVLQMLDSLEVTSPALQIPEQLEVDISQLEESGDALRVADLKLPEGIDTELDEQTPIVRLEVSRSQVAAEAEGEDDETEEAEGSEQDETSGEDSETTKQASNQS